MPTFVALYHGETLDTAKMIDVSIDPVVIDYVTKRLLNQGLSKPSISDPVLDVIEEGRVKALRLIGGEQK